MFDFLGCLCVFCEFIGIIIFHHDVDDNTVLFGVFFCVCAIHSISWNVYLSFEIAYSLQFLLLFHFLVLSCVFSSKYADFGRFTRKNGFASFSNEFVYLWMHNIRIHTFKSKANTERINSIENIIHRFSKRDANHEQPLHLLQSYRNAFYSCSMSVNEWCFWTNYYIGFYYIFSFFCILFEATMI